MGDENIFCTHLQFLQVFNLYETIVVTECIIYGFQLQAIFELITENMLNEFLYYNLHHRDFHFFVITRNHPRISSLHIKVLPSCWQGHKEWVTEVNFLGFVEHQNLVKLVGYCADDDERGIQRLLVYEFLANGSVSDHLSSRAEKTLSWAMRLRIARDAACGLTYLHEELDVQVLFFLCVSNFSQLFGYMYLYSLEDLADYLPGFQIFKHSSGRAMECKAVGLRARQVRTSRRVYSCLHGGKLDQYHPLYLISIEHCSIQA